MTEHLVNLPSTFKYLNQFAASQWAPHPSLYRCVTATEAMAGEIAYPGRWIPEQLEDALYTRFAGPDVPSDQQGLTKEQVLTWLHEVNIGHIDLADLLHDTETLRHELGAQNKQNVPQIITVGDESQLHEAVQDASGNWVRGAKLHNWVDTGLSHCFLRVGYSPDSPYGLYAEPAAPGFCTDATTGRFRSVRILWSDLMAAGVITAISIMPHNVPTPPSGFRYYGGDSQPDHLWPEPKPTINTDGATSTLHAMLAALDNLTNAVDTLKGATHNVLADLGK